MVIERCTNVWTDICSMQRHHAVRKRETWPVLKTPTRASCWGQASIPTTRAAAKTITGIWKRYSITNPLTCFFSLHTISKITDPGAKSYFKKKNSLEITVVELNQPREKKKKEKKNIYLWLTAAQELHQSTRLWTDCIWWDNVITIISHQVY